MKIMCLFIFSIATNIIISAPKQANSTIYQYLKHISHILKKHDRNIKNGGYKNVYEC